MGEVCRARDTKLDRAGNVHTGAMRLTERLWREGADRLRLEMTVDDPKAYTMPFTVRLNFNRSPIELEENVACEDVILNGKRVP